MTAGTRDRTIDAVRAWAIAGVVTGHWLVTALVPGPDGVTVASPLTTLPEAAPVTWVLQTLGLLFFAGGYAATRSRRSKAATRSRRTTAVTRSGRTDSATRSGRTGVAGLVRPVLTLVAGGALVVLVGAALGLPAATLHTVTGLLISPLWFLLPYLVLRAATGLVSRALDVLGPAGLLLPLITAVAATDLGLLPGPVALLAAWAIPWLLGMMLARREARPTDAWLGAALLCNGAAALTALVLLAGYPASAVGVPGDGRSNLDPPTLAAVALAVTQIGVFLLLRRPLARLLDHDRVWRPVQAVNRVAVPVYLGHQSVLLAVSGAAALVNPVMPGLLTAPGSPYWAGYRLAWLPVLAGILALTTRGRHHGEPDYLRHRLRGTLFPGSRARTTHGGDRCAR